MHMAFLRHLLSILLLPFMVAVVIPGWLLSSGRSAGDALLSSRGWVVLAGAILVAAGLGMLTWCVALFGRIGRGTLAPWSPTHHLVDAGPYRYVRNPMILGVALILVGEAILFRSAALWAWLAVFVLINHVYFVVLEEPGLERRFGRTYVDYRQRVPRWVPRKPT